MTQKTGQKCTAIRRVLVPAGAARRRAATRCASGSAAIAVGDPSREDVRMGPLATAQQRDDVRAGIARLAAATDAVSTAAPARSRRSASPPARASSSARSCARPSDPMACAPLNEHEVFGPVTTVGAVRRRRRRSRPTSSRAARAASSARRTPTTATGSRRFVGAAAPWAGRLYLGSSKMAAQMPGPRHRPALAAPRRPRPRRRRRGARRRARPALLHAAHRARGRRERAQVAARRRVASPVRERPASTGRRARAPTGSSAGDGGRPPACRDRARASAAG